MSEDAIAHINAALEYKPPPHRRNNDDNHTQRRSKIFGYAPYQTLILATCQRYHGWQINEIRTNNKDFHQR